MKFIAAIAVFLLVVCASHSTRAADTDLARLSWLEGLWMGTKDGVETEERWSSTKGGALLGTHKDTKNGRMVWFEFFRVDSTKDGVFYFASPQGAVATPFRMVALDDRHVTFENKEHDYPQRILYWLEANGALHARIEGPMGGKTVIEEWVWTRAAR